jgi:hypothetical protein
MLIRTGESDFCIYYKKLGPFAKLAISSLQSLEGHSSSITCVALPCDPGWRDPDRLVHPTSTAPDRSVSCIRRLQVHDPPLGHQVHPRGSLASAWLVEVGEFADMVYLKVPIRVTDLAAHYQLIRG